MTIKTAYPPYYDDYDHLKNYYRVLYRPGYPIQARELTQQQTAIQHQLEKFGKHVFKEGSIVTGGLFNIDTSFPYMMLSNLNSVNSVVNPLSFLGKDVVGQTSGVKAKIINIEKIVLDGRIYYPAYIRYLAGSETSTNNVFIPNEILVDTSNSLNNIKIEPETFGTYSVIGTGSIFSIESGVLFSNGLFIDFEKQTVVLDSFSSTPTCRVGFDINIQVISSTDDDSILDNAQGTPNYNAPGADRLKVTAILKKLPIDDTASLPAFVEVFVIKNGILQTTNERSQYAILGDEIAKRTYDESGDYYVRGLGVRIREHIDTGNNEGYLSLNNGGDSKKLVADIEPGLAYVKGYEINKLVTTHVELRKSLNYEYINSQVLTARSSNYLVLEEIAGFPELDKGFLIDLYTNVSPNLGEKRLTNHILFSVPPEGTKIGTARIKSVVPESGILGTPSGRIRLYLTDIKITDSVLGGIPDITSVYSASPYFFADVVKNVISGKTELQQSQSNPLLFPIGTSYTRTIRSDSELSDTTFSFQRTSPAITTSSAGELSISITTANEQFYYGAGALLSAEKNTIFLTLRENVDITLPGTVSGSSGQNIITGNSTQFTRLNVGDRITFADTAGTYRIQKINSAIQIELDTNLTGEVSTKSIYRTFKSGDIINLNSLGSSNGSERTVTVDSLGKTLTIQLYEDFGSEIDASISFLVTRESAYEIKKSLQSDRFVKFKCSTLTSLEDPISLGISDVFRIKSIRKHTEDFVNETDGIDVTTQFIFDSGQRDDFYDHASIQAKSQYSLEATDYLLVKLDYFAPNFTEGVGYFSVDSYPINDSQITSTTIFTHEIPVYTSINTGAKYDLRDVLDFRPVKTNTANNATTIAGATENPTTSTVFFTPANGLRLPYPSSQILIDYSYYLARRDIIGIDIQGNFAVKEGIPAIYPVSPTIMDNIMGIAKIYIPPYPSISSTFGRILGRSDISCISEKITFERHTMRDIGVLKSRIKNLEYYTSINLLEKQTNDMLIVDADGLNRFKNGFFVDPFVDHSIGDYNNDDYRISIDPLDTCLRPLTKHDSNLFELNSALSNNIRIHKSIITLNYTEEVLLEQLKATTIRNIEQSVFRYIGTIIMNPDTDVWVDTTTIDKTIFNDFSVELDDSYFDTQWNSWETYATGYSVYDRTGFSRKERLNAPLVGNFTSLESAQDAGRNANQFGRVWITTDALQSRTGTTLSLSTETITDNFGTFVTDVSLVPYIRPQKILIYVRELKPHTRFHIFFDGENMNEYVTPYIIDESWDRDLENFDFSLTASPTEGEILKTNANGEIVCYLRLPLTGKRFRVGTKEVKFTDNPTNDVSTTSYAVNYFVGHGLIQQKQNTIISTKQSVVTSKETVEYRTETIFVGTYGPSCMAYSFFVSVPETEDGIFLTSVDVFIQSIDDANQLGLNFEIREMDSSGGITRTQVPYSEVWMRYGDSRIKTSEDGSEATRIEFENPVFLMNNTQYAFVIHTEGLNPNTYFFVSRLGETDLATNTRVTARQLTGSLYTTNNNKNWDIVQDLDLKIRFNRAKFIPNSSGTARLKNEAIEYFKIKNRSDYFVNYGEVITGTELLRLTNLSSNLLNVGDELTGSSSGKFAEIVYLDGQYAGVQTTGFEVGETVTSDGSPVAVTATIQSIQTGEGRLVSCHRTKDEMKLMRSNGAFFPGSIITGQDSGVTAEIEFVNDFNYSTNYFNPNDIIFKNTEIQYSMQTVRSSTGILGEFSNITPKINTDFDHQLSLYSNSNFGDSSCNVQVLMTTQSEWVSPILDLNRTNSIFVYNILNDDIIGENQSKGGNLYNKYISKIITLADGQDAEDLRVYLSAYSPPGLTSLYPVKVWAKILNNEDGTLFKDRSWIELSYAGETLVYSSLKNKQDYKEMVFEFARSIISDSEINPGVQYESADGNTYTGFKQFAIKIGLLGNETDTARYPKVSDLRAIALQL